MNLSRAGYPWTAEEDEGLAKRLANLIAISATDQMRSVGAVRARVQMLLRDGHECLVESKVRKILSSLIINEVKIKMKSSMNFTASQAKELANVPRTLIEIENKIRKAASEGEEGVDIDGKLHYQVHAALREAGYDMTYKSECKTTWVYWGH